MEGGERERGREREGGERNGRSKTVRKIQEEKYGKKRDENREDMRREQGVKCREMYRHTVPYTVGPGWGRFRGSSTILVSPLSISRLNIKGSPASSLS